MNHPNSRPLLRHAVLGLLLVSALLSTHCTTLQQIAALQSVDFEIDRVDQGVLAGIDLRNIRSYRDLRPIDVLTVAAAVQRDRLPLAFTLHVHAENPSTNGVDARLLRLEWTLLLEGRSTINGVLDQDLRLPAGRVTDIPLRIELDLLDFYRDSARDLAELALSVAGEGGAPKTIELRARPTISTPVGPIVYPGDITIASRTVGR